jgi:hypothetical protein
MLGGTRLDQATFVVYAELAAVDVAEVDFHPGQLAAKLPQRTIHFASDKLSYSRIYAYVLVAIDLNPHTSSVPRLHEGG